MSALKRLCEGLVIVTACAFLAACNSMIPAIDFGINRPGGNPTLVKARQAHFAFAPIVGPATPIGNLMAMVNERALERRVPLVLYGDPATTYVVKGHLSAVGGPSQTTLIYVWDVVDRNDRLIFRIGGQEASDGSTPDPWVNVKANTLRIVATHTVDALAAWLSNQP